MKSFLLIALFSAIALSSSAQLFGRKYSEGAYYTIFGQKREGLLAMNPEKPDGFSSDPVNILYFKVNKDARTENIMANKIQSFIIADKDSLHTDSFVMVHQRVLKRIKYTYDFIQVIIDNGPVKLYKYRLQRRINIGFGGAFGTGAVTVGAGSAISPTYFNYYYYYGQDADSAVEIKRQTFMEAMSKVMADDPAIVKLIQDKTYTLGNMDALLKLYNSHHTPAAN